LARERLITHHKRKILRKRIGTAETAFGAVFILLVGLATIWVLAQSDNYDPGDRDISFELLEEQSDGQVLYVPPVKPWVEPGSQDALAGLPDTGPLPPEILGDGWGLDGRVEIYDPSNLYEKINGAAEQYLAFGFRSLAYVTLTRGADFINVEIYDQGEFKNALGLFSAQRASGREVLTRGEAWYYETPAGVIGAWRSYYFKVVGNSGDDAIISKASALVDVITKLPAGESEIPRPFTILTRDLGVSFDDLDYRKSDVFQYEFLSDFWFGAAEPGGDARWFIHQAFDEKQAEETLQRLVSEQKNEYATVSTDEGRVVLVHEFLKTWFVIARKGAMVFGVEGAATRESAIAALDKLNGALSRG
jgi:hypothetical protein